MKDSEVTVSPDSSLNMDPANIPVLGAMRSRITWGTHFGSGLCLHYFYFHDTFYMLIPTPTSYLCITPVPANRKKGMVHFQLTITFVSQWHGCKSPAIMIL
ncbi:hypothetical protein CHS0354_016035 [Potamilus streckersoni]|uniref:Uncharacterized protein n=1 Tax=Potamilus streckersoni TaxID=2493646 RepID=A0AAE0RMD9_9BIVA|nr:hypothetical protein CHS0354_016035 [Potamilus streckersoni]